MGPEKRTKKKCAGFTFIEMLVVIGIISTLSSVAIPAFSGWLPDYRLRGATRDLYSHIQGAKMEAVKQNADISVICETGPDRYSINGALAGPKVLGDYKSGICYGAPSGFSNTFTTITYNQRGFCTAGSGTYVYITNERKSGYYRVGPNAAGIVRLQKWNGSAFE
ncbi:MAG: prepilin-type N-terminal cleavage/methylation domain-containing protein [Deltaproteobacteria bacterium]|nr:prepilin-type N-terminal cleavage/methylation domain-containing protein [Deltaproteobacteria bacterium]